MRVFTEVSELIEEVRRDIFKSPVMCSSRVQANEVEIKAHEALNYSYAIPASVMPEDHYKLAQIGAKYFPDWEDIPGMVAWLALEGHKRFSPLDKTSRYSDDSEEYHPSLSSHIEGHHYSYTYRERMIGMLPSMESVIAKDVYSRRAYWPVFRELDAYRASDFTRVPCTLGYHFAIRNIGLKGDQLHVTNLQRSCDFNRFFLSDLWFTHLAQKIMAERLDVECGMINHTILSFHAFLDKEVY